MWLRLTVHAAQKLLALLAETEYIPAAAERAMQKEQAQQKSMEDQDEEDEVHLNMHQENYRLADALNHRSQKSISKPDGSGLHQNPVRIMGSRILVSFGSESASLRMCVCDESCMNVDIMVMFCGTIV